MQDHVAIEVYQVLTALGSYFCKSHVAECKYCTKNEFSYVLVIFHVVIWDNIKVYHFLMFSLSLAVVAGSATDCWLCIQYFIVR